MFASVHDTYLKIFRQKKTRYVNTTSKIPRHSNMQFFASRSGFKDYCNIIVIDNLRPDLIPILKYEYRM